MGLFWERGYVGTSTAELVEQMAVNRYSVYAEFGSKRELYEAALARYMATIAPGYVGALHEAEAGLETIVTILRRFGAAAGTPESKRGCLLCNAATEMAPHDLAARSWVQRYVRYLEVGFLHALDQAAASGELDADIDRPAWSRRLATTMMGIFVLLRSQVDAALVQDTVELTIADLSRGRRS